MDVLIATFQQAVDRFLSKLLASGLLEILLLAFAAVAAMTICFVLFNAVNREQHHRKERIARAITRTAGAKSRQSDQQAGLLLQSGQANVVEQLFARLIPKPEKFRQYLARTGFRHLTPGRFMLIAALIALGIMLVNIGLFGLEFFRGFLLACATGLGTTHMAIGTIIRRRETKFLQNLPEGIDIAIRGLRAGLPITESLRAIGQEAVEPVKSVFQQVTERMEIGDSVEGALQYAAKTIPLPEMQFLGVTIAVQRETGGNLAETLANLGDILRKRRQMKLKVRALSSEARASAMILGSLPFVVGLLIFIVNNSYMMQLFTDPRGIFMVIAGLFMAVTGIAIMVKLIRFDF